MTCLDSAYFAELEAACIDILPEEELAYIRDSSEALEAWNWATGFLKEHGISDPDKWLMEKGVYP